MGLPAHRCISWMPNGTLEGVDGNGVWLDLRLPVGACWEKRLKKRDCSIYMSARI